MTKRSNVRALRIDRSEVSQDRQLGKPGRGNRNGWDPIGGYSYQKNVSPKTDNQHALMKAILEKDLVLALGPAGTGKTYLSVCMAVEALLAGKIERIVLSRPAVEAGEQLGFLPGDITEKMSAFLRPLYDVLHDRVGGKETKRMIAEGEIEIATIGHMRGRTLNRAFVILDEAQNCTYAQLKMAVTRIGHGSTMILTGDPDQSDLMPGMSGLAELASRLESLPDVGVVRLDQCDVQRHALVATMLTVL